MIKLRIDPAHEATGREAIQLPVIAEISIDRPPHAHCLGATEAALPHQLREILEERLLMAASVRREKESAARRGRLGVRAVR